jgi:hypothetical protein
MPLGTAQVPSAIARPTTGAAGTPGPVLPLLSMLPGLLCWLLFASAAMPAELPVTDRLTALIGPGAANGVMLGTWCLALTTSIVAALHYGRRTQAWYTTLSIAFHLAGLIFSLLLLGGLLLLWIA